MENSIDNLTQYISKQITPEDMTVYRGESFGFLNSIKLSNFQDLVETLKYEEVINNFEIDENTSLGELCELFTQSDPNECVGAKLINNILSNYIFEGVQERFLSTALDSGFEGPIQWTIDIPAGTQAAYLESVNIPANEYIEEDNDTLLSNSCKNYHNENELLLQRNSTILIDSIIFKEYEEPEYDNKGNLIYGFWNLHGRVIN